MNDPRSTASTLKFMLDKGAQPVKPGGSSVQPGDETDLGTKPGKKTRSTVPQAKRLRPEQVRAFLS